MMKDVCERFPAARKALDDFSAILNRDIPALLWETDAETLARSDYSQLALTCASLAAAAALKTGGITPAVCAGFSLGEWPALCVSGVLSVEDTLNLVKQRGEIMQRVCTELAESGGAERAGMAAVTGLPPESVRELTAASGIADLYAVNLNSQRQTVISGTAAALASAQEYFKENGARRVIRLNVAGPFHSPLMQKAADEFAAVVAEAAFREPVCAVFSNVTGKRIPSAAEAKALAARHISSPVLWTDEETSFAGHLNSKAPGNWKLLEAGPGKVLCGLWKDSGLEGECLPAGEAAEIEALLQQP
jgi:[acyl-carrier-protein] S-malonyltransferase